MIKTHKIIAITFTTLAILMVLFGAIMKLSKSEEVVNTLTKVGVGNYITLLGVMEIAFAALFIYPKTIKIGFILLCCYFAGAMATELSHNVPLNAIIPMIFIWIAAFLRDRSIFLPTAENSIKS